MKNWLFLSLVILCAVQSIQAADRPHVQIFEISLDQGAMTPDFIKVRNTGPQAVNLARLSLRLDFESAHSLTSEAIWLEPGDSVLLTSDLTSFGSRMAIRSLEIPALAGVWDWLSHPNEHQSDSWTSLQLVAASYGVLDEVYWDRWTELPEDQQVTGVCLRSPSTEWNFKHFYLSNWIIQPAKMLETASSLDFQPKAQIEEEATDGLTLELFPNPAQLNVTIHGLEIGNTLRLINTSGRVLRTTPVLQSFLEWDVSSLPRGLYYIDYQSGPSRQSTSFFKQ